MTKQQKSADLPFQSLCDHTFFTKGMGPRSVVIDAGANTGGFSASVFERFGCTPYALEPNATSAEQIKKAHIFPMALAAYNTQMEFFISGCSEGCSLICFPGHTQRRTVPTVTLATFMAENRIDRVDLLKLDIEGAELEVLLTAPTSLLRKIAQVTVEFHDFLHPEHGPMVRESVSRMAALGFMRFTFSSPQNTDVLFVNPALLALSHKVVLRARSRVIARHIRRVLRLA